HEADARRHALEEPNMANRHGQFDMAHALAANAGEGDFHAAAITNDAAVLDAFILSAGAFPVLHRTENAFAEQAALLGLERAVIDGLGVFDFPLGPGTNGFGRRDLDRDVLHLIHLVQTEQLSGIFFRANHTILFQRIFLS